VERVSFFALTGHVFRRSWENLCRSTVTWSLTVITIAVALSVLSLFALVVRNCALSVERETGDMMVMIFLRDSATRMDADALKNEIADLTTGLDVSYMDKGQALESFRKMLGDDAVMLQGLDAQNPLPASVNITLDNPTRADKLFEVVSDRLASSAVIESIRYSRSGVQQLKRILRMVEVGGGIGMIFLLVITGFIIANTIKLALYNHRMEIEIMELVGSRRGSIYAPYVLEGLGQGIVGAAVGIAMLFSSFQFLPFTALLYIVVAGAVVGMSGSFLAVRKFLSEQ
jgi:cell division transport system permease protein